VSKIIFLNAVSPQALLAQIAEREGLDGFVGVVRVNGCWYSCWPDGLDHGALSMAAVKLLTDVQARMHGEELTWTPPQGDEVA
jgi:hypothetical protein